MKEHKTFPQSPSGANSLLFLLPSFLGILLFIIPINFDDHLTLLVAVFAKFLEKTLGYRLPLISCVLIASSAFLTLLSYYLKRFSQHNILTHFQAGRFWSTVKVLGAVFAGLSFFKLGPDFIASEQTGGFILNELMGLLFCVFLFAGFLLPLLLNYGLLEFCGIICAPFMRPIFTLPGRASIDCLASCLGDGTIGILLTNKQYEQGYYTQREAAVIGTTFSLVSITFTIVILSMARLDHYIGPYYLAIFLSTLATAIICPRIPPLSQKKNIYYNQQTKNDQEDKIPLGQTRFMWGFKKACEAASQNKDIKKFFKEGLKNVFEMWFGVLPIVMCFGTIALIIANYTIFFKVLGAPFIPVLKLLGIPEATAASQTIVIGFADMFLPVTLASNIQSEMTRFVIACLSVSQLIFMSEVGSILLGSKIPVNFKDLCLIFLQRTLICLPIISTIAHLTF